MHPVIGIPCHTYDRAALEQSVYGNRPAYVQAVEDAGGLPVIIPMFTNPAKLEKLLSRLDGLLFTGGKDIQPVYYGETPEPTLYSVDPQLDAFEIALVTWALQKDIPVLGICRGMQLINIVRGGTLCQDISAQNPDALQHCRLDLPRTELIHHVTVEQGSFMQSILGTRRLAVNSLHHQAVKEPGRGVRLSGWADDGTCELLEVPDRRFAVGVQCHPEDIYQEIPAFAALFQTFIHLCTEPAPQRVALFGPGQTLQVLKSAAA